MRDARRRLPAMLNGITHQVFEQLHEPVGVAVNARQVVIIDNLGRAVAQIRCEFSQNGPHQHVGFRRLEGACVNV